MRAARARHFVAALREAGAKPTAARSLVALANACGVSDDYLGMVLRGTKPLAPSIVGKVANATGLTRQLVRACFLLGRSSVGAAS
jgi:hypothetical protein